MSLLPYLGRFGTGPAGFQPLVARVVVGGRRHGTTCSIFPIQNIELRVNQKAVMLELDDDPSHACNPAQAQPSPPGLRAVLTDSEVATVLRYSCPVPRTS